MLLTVVLVFQAITLCFAKYRGITAEAEDADLSVPQLVRKYGYPIEEHYVITPDGFMIIIHRIPHGKNSTVPSKKVAFLQHGLFCSSSFWLVTGVGHALGYLLADRGFDVWLGNTRGNSYGSRNLYLSRRSRKYWHYSWHEIGYYDLPTMIDYVLAVTKQKSLYHIGHSQGTTTFYVMASTRPEYNAKIKAHLSLSPIAYMEYTGNPLVRLAAKVTSIIHYTSKLLGKHHYLSRSKTRTAWLRHLCSGDFQHVCGNFFTVAVGPNPKELNNTFLPIFFGHSLESTSLMQLEHYLQLITAGQFRQYDHGLMNICKYGSFKPPDYDLSKITAPVYLYYSNNDWFSEPRDVFRLCDKLTYHCKEKILVADGAYNHMDYGLAINAPKMVYELVIEKMQQLDESV